MTSHPKTLAALALVSVLLTACGGGGGGGGSFSSTTSSNVAATPDAGTAPELVAVVDTATSTGSSAVLVVDSDPSTEPGVLTVTEATIPGIDGVYGAPGAVSVTEVYLQAGFGVQPELCAYKFTGADRAGAVPVAGTVTGIATAFGKITYRPTAMGLYFAFLTFNGKEYSSGDAVDTVVDRDNHRVRFTSKTLTATDGSNHTLKLNAVIPLHTIRNAKC